MNRRRAWPVALSLGLALSAFGTCFRSADVEAYVPLRDTTAHAENYWVLLRKVEDVDRITIVFAKTKFLAEKEAGLILSNVLPFSQWPVEMDDDAKKLKADALKRLKAMLEGKRVGYLRGRLKGEVGDTLRGDLYRSLGEDGWPGGTPAGFLGWGQTFLNALVIQEGLSVYVREDTLVLGPQESSMAWHDKRRAEWLEQAEQFAEKSQAGIWRQRAFALRVRAAARR